MDPVTVLSRYADYRFYELERLAEFIESSVRKELKWWKEWVEKETEHMTQEETEEFGEQYSDEYQMVDQDFRRHLRYGYVVTVYGMTESQLNRTCSIIKRSRNKYKKEQIQLDVKDINAESIIQRAKKYLEKVLLLSFPKPDRSWQEITTLSKVRNVIVHGRRYGTLLTMLNNSDAKIFLEVSMGGRFGKYGDAKRKAQIPRNSLKRRTYPIGIMHVLHERPGEFKLLDKITIG